MTPYEMGKVSAYLLKHRRIEERSQRRPIQREERDLAEILREAAVDEMRELEEMMAGFGFTFTTLTAFDVKGIAPGTRSYMLVRLTNVNCPLLEPPKVIEALTPKPAKTAIAKIWFTQIWLLHLDLMYSAKDRAPSERNQWLESGFTKEQLIDAVRAHVNGFVRKLNPDLIASSEVYSVLCAEKGTDIVRYVTRFLDLMVDAAMLEEIVPGTSYRQSLLAAVEMKANYDRVLAPLMLEMAPTGDDTALAALAQPLLTATSNNPTNDRTDA